MFFSKFQPPHLKIPACAPVPNHRCRNKHIFGGAKYFCTHFHKLVQKVVVQLLLTVCLVWPPKMAFIYFSANVRRHFLTSNNVGAISTQIFRNFSHIFEGFCREFQQIKTFASALAPPAPSPPTPLYQTKFDSLYVMRKTQYPWWQLYWWHKGVVLKTVWKPT